MPSKSKKQARFMAAVANNPNFAKKAGVPQSVGQEFANADKRNKDMPSKYNSTANKPGKAVKKGYARGGMAHDKRVLRNLDDEVYRIADKERMGGAEGRDARQERLRINKEKRFEKNRMDGMARGGPVKPQGDNARLDDSMGARSGKKSQSETARRNESEGMERSMGRRKFAGAGTMDVGSKKMVAGGGVSGGRSSASTRGDGIATKGHTRGRMV